MPEDDEPPPAKDNADDGPPPVIDIHVNVDIKEGQDDIERK
jgi:hypothetical protein